MRAVGNLSNLRAAVEADCQWRRGRCRRAPGDDRRRPHPLGDPRQGDRGERPPPQRLLRPNPHRPQRDRREPRRRCAASSRSEGHRFSSETDAEIVAHLIERHYEGDLTEAVRVSFGELRGHYAFVAICADQPEMLVGARKECPLIAGLGEGENFLASAIPAFLARDPARDADRERRDRHRRRPGRRITDAAGDPGRARGRGGHLGRGRRREGRLPDLHDEGDPRAGRRGRRDDRRPAADRRRRRPLRGRPRRRVPARPAPDRDRRLRHLLPRGTGRPLRDRGVGAGAGRDGHRLRVPLPQPGGRHGRPGDRHHPVGRDRRHPGGDAAGPRARGEGAGDNQHHGQPGDPRRRRRPLHPRRARDRGGGDQDLRRPGCGDVPARPAPRAAARHALAGARLRAGRSS